MAAHNNAFKPAIIYTVLLKEPCNYSKSACQRLPCVIIANTVLFKRLRGDAEILFGVRLLFETQSDGTVLR